MRAKNLLSFGLQAVRTCLGRLNRPYKLTFSVTDKCNLRCRSCNIWKQKIGDELSIDEIDLFFSKNPGIYWLDLTGGEVMLRQDFPEITRSAVRNLPHLFQFHFPTNGTLPDRTERSTQIALDLGIPKVVVSVSIDGPPRLHDELRDRHGTWESAVETYGRIKALPGAEVYFGMTLGAENLDLVSETIDSIAAKIPGFGPADLHLNIAHDTFYYGNPGVSPLAPHEVEAVLRSFMGMRGFPSNPVLLLEWLYQRKVPQYLETRKSPIRCQALSASLFLTATGDVFPCTSYEEKLGNLRDVDFDLGVVWDQPTSIRLFEEIKRGQCPGCWTPCEAYQSIMASLPRPGTWLTRTSHRLSKRSPSEPRA